jgi:multidrug efflux pump subunit AcrA (membrane-fusion protein)
VKDLSVKLGQSVKAGEQLFSISNPSLDTAVERDEASYDSARQQVKSARASLTQARNTLYTTQHPGNAASKPLQSAVYVRAVKLAKQQVCVAEAGLSAAEEGLDSASQSLSVDKDNADQRTVTAPVSGVITALNAANGVALSGGSSSSSSGSSSSGSASAASVSSSANSAVEIADLSTLKAQIQINEVDLVNVKVGQSASVTFDALPSDPVSGTVTAVAPTGVNSSGVVSYNVDITLASVDKRLRPTMSCSADINTATHTDALVVPSTAVHTNATTQSHYVVVLASDGSQRQVTVKTGLIVGTQTEILSGLQAGQDVVTSSSSTTSGSTATSSSTATSGSSGANRGGGGGIGALLGR